MKIQQLRAQIAALQDATMDENKNFRTAYDEGKFDALSAVDALFDSLQEEPVSELWHDASEEPNDMSHCLIFYGYKESVGHYLHYEPVLYNKKEKMFVTSSFPHPTGNKVEQKSFDGGCVAEVYKDKRDRISISDITQWCYLCDLHNLSNVERTVKDWKEEPVAPKVLEDMLNAKTAAESLGISQEEHDRIVDELIYGKEPELVDDLSNKEKEPVSEGLEEAANDYAHDLLHDDVFETFIAGAQWQKGKTLSDLKKAVTGKMFQFTMNNVEARGDDPNGKTVTLEDPVTFHINNPESIIDALIMELENNN